MTKSELLRHMLANVESGRACFHGLLYKNETTTRVLDFAELLDLADGFSIAPRTRVINGFTVPAPMEKEPEKGTPYFCENPASTSWVHGAYRWDGDATDKQRFMIGIHTTSESAAANCKARYGIDPKWGGE